jgi:beta-phosphoglucomutase-like phosphatase (HAD superfamily)
VLCLFDIDGTLLIKAADDHRAALLAAMRRVYRIAHPESAKVETAGRTDPAIARQIALQLGLSAERFDDGLRDFKRCAAEEYAQRCRDDLSAHVAPGVLDLRHRQPRADRARQARASRHRPALRARPRRLRLRPRGPQRAAGHRALAGGHRAGAAVPA